jgi:flagellin
MKTVDAYGTSATGAQTFNALQYGNESQVLTFSATDSSGALETKSITLQNNAAGNRAGRSVDDAVAYINQQLQASGVTAALQSIVAVKEVSGGSEKINFVSSLAGFTVGVGGVNTGSTDGLNGGSQAFLQGAANGSAANMSIGTQEGAQAAVTAISAAIAKLGSAQAAVGKGENQLGYAINLAQSQITNFSAAESQIRDANIAQQAANLTKAQVLQQAAIAAMAQANSAPQAVLKLLQG